MMQQESSLLPRNSFIVVILGPSGVGKDTLVQEMKRLNKPPFLHMNESHTTRKQRPSDPAYYRFVSEEEFQKLEQSGFFLQTNKEIYGKWYGTPFPKTLPPATAEAFILFADSALKVKSHFPNTKIYLIEPPSLEELRRRLEQRSSDPNDIRRRMDNAAVELETDRPIADQVFINETGKQKETARRLHSAIRSDWQSLS